MDYKLKNRDGAETTYTKEKLKIPAATGDSRVVFTEGEAQAEKTVDIAENGAFTVEPDVGFAFVKKVSGTVAVPTPEPVLQEKSVNITSNGQTSVTPDSGKDGLSKVDITVAVPTPAPKLQKKSVSITANSSGSVLPDAGNDGLSEVDYTVDVPASTPVLQEKTLTITENGTTEVTPDSGQDGLSKVAITASVPSIITGALSEVIPAAFEVLKKAQSLPAQPYGMFLKRGVPVYFMISIDATSFLLWGALRFLNDRPTTGSVIWQSRVISKSEWGGGNAIFFEVKFSIKEIGTNLYTLNTINADSQSISDLPSRLNEGRCATITNWLS